MKDLLVSLEVACNHLKRRLALLLKKQPSAMQVFWEELTLSRFGLSPSLKKLSRQPLSLIKVSRQPLSLMKLSRQRLLMLLKFLARIRERGVSRKIQTKKYFIESQRTKLISKSKNKNKPEQTKQNKKRNERYETKNGINFSYTVQTAKILIEKCRWDCFWYSFFTNKT